MKTGIIVRALIASKIAIFSIPAHAWTIANSIVDLPKEVEQAEASLDIKTTSELINPTDFEMGYTASPSTKVENGPIFEKTQAKLTDDEEALMDYQQAKQYLQQGEVALAEQFLKRALDGVPAHVTSRIELSNLYLKRNQLEQAEAILTEGLKLDEQNSDYLRLMAVVQDKKKEPEKALALLIRIKDSHKQDKNYIAFLGHIYQETGHYALARQQYFRLLQLEPKNPLWLLGVSIALDAEGQKDAALEGYHRLTTEGNVDPSVLEYAQERIHALQG